MFDIFLLLVCLFCTALGFYWGLLRQLIALVGLLVAAILAGRYGDLVAAWLSSFIADRMLGEAIGFMLVLLLVSTLASLVASLLRLRVGLLFLTWWDHAAGGLLGVCQALLFGSILLVAGVTFQRALWEPLLDTSLLADPLLRLGAPLTFLLRDEFRQAVLALL